MKGAAVLAGTSALAVRGRAANASTPAAVRKRTAAAHSSLAWNSGCWNGNDAPSEATAFGDWRGNPVDVAVAWPDLGSWSSYTTQPNSIYAAFSGAPFPIVWGISPIPFDGGVSTMAACAAGDYNSNWTDFANTMVAYGLDNSIIRLGWELNGDWYPWGGDPNFVAAWQQIVNTVRPIAPGLQWDWNVNIGSNNGFPGDAVLGAYPGDTYVDIIGVDAYDKGGVTPDYVVDGAYALQYWLNFAVAHGKKLSLPEWGVWTTANQGHGDDPDYITAVGTFLANNASNIAFDAYFNDAEASIGNSLYNPDQNPNSAAVYLNLFGGGGGGGGFSVTNPGFESGDLTGWGNTAGDATVQSSVVHSGSYAAQIGASSSGVNQVIAGLTPSTSYTLSAWVNNTASDTTGVGVKDFGGEETYVGASGTGWQQGSVNFTTGSSNSTAMVYIWKNAGTGITYGDDFSLDLNVVAGSNLASNPGFESGDLTGWGNTSGDATVQTSAVHSGSYAVQTGISNSGVYQDISGLSPSTTYTLSGWVNNTDASDVTGVGVKNFGGLEIFVSTAGTGWQQASLKFTTGSSNTTAQIYLWKNAGSGITYGDDFSLTQD